MPRIDLSSFAHEPGQELGLRLPGHVVAELERLASTAEEVADESGLDAVAGLQPVMVFCGATEAAALMGAASWCRDHAGSSSTVIASWFRFVADDAEPYYEAGLVLEC
ncbi:hypothetical protein ACFOY4_10110 [Actinomadura syzygii]|uniref:Uncharacterized protein n=1 Tax=Actinomadura syzygii TaxID=1427538 RepID=A0A5D0UDU9_9ACTN|nr:hypothetical protein [Actinomadura syzygii]TYC15832.1 hypothetical protein FXF65_10850 [Actinomadura syzygii]